MMKKKLFILIVSLSILLVGCASKTANQEATTSNEEVTTENQETTLVEEPTLQALDVEYAENEDGTYTCRGYDFKYKIEVPAVEGVKEGTFVILTNNKDISYETVSGSLKDSNSTTGEPEFVILGWY